MVLQNHIELRCLNGHHCIVSSLVRRTRDVSIEVGKTLDAMKEVATIPGTVADIEEVQMPVGTFVRYFKITLKAKEFLHFCEVEIFGYMCD